MQNLPPVSVTMQRIDVPSTERLAWSLGVPADRCSKYRTFGLEPRCTGWSMFQVQNVWLGAEAYRLIDVPSTERLAWSRGVPADRCSKYRTFGLEPRRTGWSMFQVQNVWLGAEAYRLIDVPSTERLAWSRGLPADRCSKYRMFGLEPRRTGWSMFQVQNVWLGAEAYRLIDVPSTERLAWSWGLPADRCSKYRTFGLEPRRTGWSMFQVQNVWLGAEAYRLIDVPSTERLAWSWGLPADRCSKYRTFGLEPRRTGWSMFQVQNVWLGAEAYRLIDVPSTERLAWSRGIPADRCSKYRTFGLEPRRTGWSMFQVQNVWLGAEAYRLIDVPSTERLAWSRGVPADRCSKYRTFGLEPRCTGWLMFQVQNVWLGAEAYRLIDVPSTERLAWSRGIPADRWSKYRTFGLEPRHTGWLMFQVQNVWLGAEAYRLIDVPSTERLAWSRGVPADWCSKYRTFGLEPRCTGWLMFRVQNVWLGAEAYRLIDVPSTDRLAWSRGVPADWCSKYRTFGLEPRRTGWLMFQVQNVWLGAEAYRLIDVPSTERLAWSRGVPADRCSKYRTFGLEPRRTGWSMFQVQNVWLGAEVYRLIDVPSTERLAWSRGVPADWCSEYRTFGLEPRCTGWLMFQVQNVWLGAEAYRLIDVPSTDRLAWSRGVPADWCSKYRPFGLEPRCTGWLMFQVQNVWLGAEAYRLIDVPSTERLAWSRGVPADRCSKYRTFGLEPRRTGWLMFQVQNVWLGAEVYRLIDVPSTERLAWSRGVPADWCSEYRTFGLEPRLTGWLMFQVQNVWLGAEVYQLIDVPSTERLAWSRGVPADWCSKYRTFGLEPRLTGWLMFQVQNVWLGAKAYRLIDVPSTERLAWSRGVPADRPGWLQGRYWIFSRMA